MSKQLFARDHFVDEDADSGVKISHFAQAITTWVAMTELRSVADAMATFNTTREVVIETVEYAYWAFLSDPTCDDPSRTMIELDGE